MAYSVDACAFRNNVRVATVLGKTGEWATCSFCADGLSCAHSLARRQCESCARMGGPPNQLTTLTRDGILGSRVCEPHIPDGKDKPYRISVDDAAAAISGTALLPKVIEKSLERGHQTVGVALRLLRTHVGEDPERDRQVLVREVMARRCQPSVAAALAVELGL